jgi:alginate O-acetyltransferase complex protein AlgJ
MQSDLVHVGKDGWLFLVGGTNNVLEYYVEPDRFSANLVSKWLTLLQSRNARAADIGARYIHLIAPEKLTVYPEHYDGDLPYFDSCPSLRLVSAARAAQVDNLVVDVVSFMNELKPRYPLYWKTDTHWTFYGCFGAYQMLCSQLGVPQNTKLLQGKRNSGRIVLDLGAKFDPPIREEFSTVDFKATSRCISTNALVNYKKKKNAENDGGLHVGSNVVFVNNGPDAIDKRVVLFGDSFSEYRPHLLTGMLAETFREFHFVWSISIDWSYVERVQPDILITQSAERFMGNVPDDKFDLDTYVVRKLAALL